MTHDPLVCGIFYYSTCKMCRPNFLLSEREDEVSFEDATTWAQSHDAKLLTNKQYRRAIELYDQMRREKSACISREGKR